MKPKQIDYKEWHRFFKSIPDDDIENTRYYRHLKDAEWSQYLFPPSTHLIYGNRLLRKLKFDNSQASLRLWGYVLSEGERIFRARQTNMNIAAVMGDLGAVPPLIYSFKNVTAFYPDCLWWTPFLMESSVLFDEAAELGIGEESCFVRAALGAFSKRAYFPKPDISIGTVGATCDDMAAVISETELQGNKVHYFEHPQRNDFATDNRHLIDFLRDQYRQLCSQLEKITGQSFSDTQFFDTIEKVNVLRNIIKDIKSILSEASLNTMGACEMMNIEFSALSYYGDLDECILVMKNIRNEMKKRQIDKTGYDNQDIRILWVTPPADLLLLNYIEELGGRVVGSEYLINQTTTAFRTEGDPFEILAENHLKGSLMGSSDFRVKLVLDELERTKAEGVILSGVFGSSHCPYETVPIINALRRKKIPVLAFDVVSPGKKRLQSQIFNRMEAFMESLRMRRVKYAR